MSIDTAFFQACMARSFFLCSVSSSSASLCSSNWCTIALVSTRSTYHAQATTSIAAIGMAHVIICSISVCSIVITMANMLVIGMSL